MTSAAGSLGRWLEERRLVLALGIAAALPFIVAAIDAASLDWVPYGDDAVIATRSLDVFTHNSPLFGQWTSGPAEVLDARAYTPGPTLYWLLALPARFLDPVWMAVTIALVNVACVIGTVGLAHRRGGRGFMFATAIAIPIMLASLPAGTYSDVWNPSVPLPPLMLLVFLAWSLGCGEYRLLPLTALVAGFIVTTHLSYVAPTLAVTAVGLAGLVIARRSGAGTDGRPLRWLAAAVAVTVVLSTPALIDEATNSPGNLAVLRLVATSDVPKLGTEPALRAVAHTVGIPPWWLQGPGEPLERIGDLSAGPSLLTVASALLALAGLAAMVLLGWQRRSPDVAIAGVLGLGLCAAAAVNTASTPQDAFDTVHYTLRWASVAGMFVWLVLAWGLTVLLLGGRRPTRVGSRLASLGAGAAVVAAGAAVAFSADAPTEPYRQVRAATESVDAALAPDVPVRVDASSGGGGIFLAVNFQAGIVFALRRDGHDVVAPTISNLLGEAYEDGDYRQVVRVRVDEPAPERNRVIARVPVRDTFESADVPRHVVTVSLDPAPAAGGSRRD